MRRQIVILSLLLTGVIASGWLALARKGHAPAGKRPLVDHAKANAAFHKDVLPVLNQYCWDCHADGANKGDVTLDQFTNVTAVLKDRRTWERVLHTIGSGEMPPKKKKQPEEAQRMTVTSWIEKTLFPVDPNNPDPGRVTIRRLNRTEYNNTVRDLVGVDFKPADDFPQDDVGYGFDNIGDVLSLPPILLEKYLKAAEKVLDEAIVTGPRPAPVKKFDESQLEGGQDLGPLRGLAANGEITVPMTFSHPGKYQVSFKAFQDRAGDEAAKIAVRLGGRDLKQFEVKQRKDKPGSFELEFDVPAASADRLTVAFLNDYYVEKWVERERGEGRPPRKEKVTEDRNFFCQDFEVAGPLGVEPPIPASHHRIFFKAPVAGKEVETARELVGTFTKRAWRRPVAKADLDRLMTLFAEAKAGGDNFEASVKHVLTAVLVSPHFLFRGEIQPDPNNPKRVHDVDEWALASRLSYFLWSSLPDDELFALAEKGRLRKNLSAQVQRMLHDPRARALTENFAGQWLQLQLLDVIEPDRKKFPEFSDELRRDMRRETERFFEHIVREDRPVSDFLLADYTFVNGRLAQHYGLEGVDGDDFVQVSLKDSPRQGMLTQGSILTLTSNPTRTSPVKRGKWVLDNVLATPPPPPPPGVPELEAGEKLTGTLRQRMEKHRDNAGCASCHARMDPIGFGFEHFDGIGRYRDQDGKEPVETAGELTSGEKFTDHRGLNAVLAQAKRADFLRCLAEKLLTYSLGRGLEYYDKPTVARIVQQLEKGDLKFSALVMGVVESAPFQKRRGEGDPTQMAAAK
jgi:hypothetical protein